MSAPVRPSPARMLSASDCLKSSGCLASVRPRTAWNCQARSVRKQSSASRRSRVRPRTRRPGSSRPPARRPRAPPDRRRTRRRGRRENATRSPSSGPALDCRAARRRTPAARAGRAGRGPRSPRAAGPGRRRCGPSGPPDSDSHALDCGHSGTRPSDGRSPTTLQNDAGLRSDPPMSLPSASGTMPAGQCRRGPPARSAGRAGRVVRVAGRAEDLVERVRPRGVLRDVGLADHDDARLADALDDELVARGHVVLEHPRAVRRAPARHLVGVLERERQPVQGPAVHPWRRPPRAPTPGALEVEAHDGVDLGVALLDAARCASSSSRAEISLARRAASIERALRRVLRRSPRDRSGCPRGR